jgi:hypothetical protein
MTQTITLPPKCAYKRSKRNWRASWGTVMGTFCIASPSFAIQNLIAKR